jgi:hypothetical protein
MTKNNPNKVLGKLSPILLRKNSLVEPIVKNPFKYDIHLKSVDIMKVIT